MSLASVMQQHRAALLARDQQIANQIANHYQAIWLKIHARLAQLTQKIQAALDAGEEIKVSWLYEQNRLQSLLADVQKDVSGFADTTQSVVQQQMEIAAQAGSQDAQNMLESALGRVQTSFNRLPSDAIRQAVYNAETDQHLQKLFADFDTQAVDAVKRDLVTGVALGKNPRIIARDVQQSLQVPLNRALRIARTEMIGAYRDSAINSYRANADVVQGWIWSAAAGACPFCQSMNGTEHSLDEDMNSHPNCRCAPIPKTVSYEQILQGAVA